MKKFLFILAAVVLGACSQQGENPEMHISGTIENSPSTSFEVFYFTDFIQNNTETVSVDLDENHGFSATLPLSEAQFVYVRLPQRTITFYASPGADIHLAYDAGEETQIRFSGSLALENQYLADYAEQIGRNMNPRDIMNRAASMDPDEFLLYVNQLEEEKLQHLQNADGFLQIDPLFLDLQKAGFRYEKYSLMMDYPRMIAQRNQGVQPELPAEYYDFLQDENLISDRYLKVRPYVSFVNSYLNYQITNDAAEADTRSYYERQFDQALELAPGKTRDLVLSQVMVSLLNFASLEVAQEKYQDYLGLVNTPEFKELIGREHGKVMALAPGQKAPGFTLTDIDGKEVSLNDFAGKVVYLDFWASWCGPCMREVPHFAELKKRMADQRDLVYLYVSVDTDEQAWRNTVDSHGITGVHLNVSGFGHEVPAAYNLKGVPTFYLIGRDGNIIDNRPPRPSNPRIDQVLLDALAMEI